MCETRGGKHDGNVFTLHQELNQKQRRKPVIKDIGFLIKRCTCQHTVSQSKFHNSHSNENGEKSPGKSKNSGTNMLNNVSHKVAETKAEVLQTIITSHGVQDRKNVLGTTHGKGPARASPRTLPSGPHMCPSSPLPLVTVARRSGRCHTGAASPGRPCRQRGHPAST